MIVFPNAKINIGLQVTGKRADGYHNLQTIFFPVQVKDALEIISNDGQEAPFTFSQTGDPITGKEENNLCIKAWKLLKNDFPALPAIRMHLHKSIPMGAGLGGGSADGSFTLQLINKKYRLGLTDTQLAGYALQLGSDCPFFIFNKPCYATGRGELLKEQPLDLSSYKILIVNPGIHISTAWAFASLSPTASSVNLVEAVQHPVEKWKGMVINDFEKPVLAAWPAIAELKETLYRSGALYASLSGSGSTVYGIFRKEPEPVLNFPAGYFYKWA
jgi:4-diphosphocytidyl-2-C-methyl-D-erythritol kinase